MRCMYFYMRQEAVGGISNEGYWGIPVEAGRQYALSLYLSAAQARPPPCHIPANTVIPSKVACA